MALTNESTAPVIHAAVSIGEQQHLSKLPDCACVSVKQFMQNPKGSMRSVQTGKCVAIVNDAGRIAAIIGNGSSVTDDDTLSPEAILEQAAVSLARPAPN
jgi:hypothetical protein